MRIIAHRGDSAREPENTMPAFEAAIAAGADAIEFDVRLTVDGHPVVMHDDDVARTTGAAGLISAMTRDEVAALRIPRPDGDPARVPGLEEVLESLAGRIHLIVELKAIPVGDAFSAAPVLEVVAPMLAGVPSVTLDSFDPNVLDAAATRLAGMPRALACLRHGDDWMLPFAHEHGYDALMLPYPEADEAWVAEAHARDLVVWAWSAGAEDVPRAGAMGLDGVLVSDPSAARAASGEHG